MPKSVTVSLLLSQILSPHVSNSCQVPQPPPRYSQRTDPPAVGAKPPHFEELLQDGNIFSIYHLLTCFT